jgi:hypothetical protein
MRSRYYKIARRRALWESEESYIRPWRHNRLWATRYCDYKPLSSTGSSSQEPKERDSEPESEDKYHTVYKDFESFRAAVDRAIARDPYGTLFGRRLQSPPSSNNSSWTSFSWFTDPKEIKEDASVPSSQPKLSETASSPVEKPSAEASVDPAQQTAQATTTFYSEEEYEYDPITMRKVPMRNRPPKPEHVSSASSENLPSPPEVKEQALKHQTEKPSSQPEPKKEPSEHKSKQPFLQSLFFQEHGVDIPVKTFKHHKVYGYGAPEKKADDTSAVTPSAETKGDFESSRKQHLRDLMSRVKGNNIDTTALFTEPFPQPENEAVGQDSTVSKKPRESPEPDDARPLFSGTTYEGRANKETQVKSSDWLAKEGFRQLPDEAPSKGSSTDSTVDIPVKTFTPKLEPALDRAYARAAQDSKDKVAKLQTALDRQQSALKRRLSSTDLQPESPATVVNIPEEEKKAKRAKLEAAFEAMQNDAANEVDFSPKSRRVEASTSKLSKTINNVWAHIQQHPDGIVAKTMKSMTNFNENYKKYIRPNNVKGLTDKLLFKDESLSKTPSIYKQKAKAPKIDFVTPSYEVADAEKEQQQRTASLKAAAKESKKDADVQRAQISKLATDIQAVYESEYGVIPRACLRNCYASYFRLPSATLQRCRPSLDCKHQAWGDNKSSH